MPTNITGKNFDLTEAIQSYIDEKTAALTKVYDNIIQIDVELDKNLHHNKGDVFHVRMNVAVPNELLHAEEVQPDLYAAIDICRDEIDRQLRKYKEKFATRSRKARQTSRNLKSILAFWRRP
jgi:ribosomal subunit interface protein